MRQRVFTSAINLFIPDFYNRVFEPDYVPIEKKQRDEDGGEIFFPATDDEFDRMLAEFEATDALEGKHHFDAL